MMRRRPRSRQAELPTPEAKWVIVSAPGVLDTFIRFDPILPADRAQLQQRVPQGTVWKIWLVYDRAFWRDQGLSGDTISIQPGDFIPNSRDSGPPAEQRMPGLMVCFVVGPRASIFNARGQLSPTIRFPAGPGRQPRSLRDPWVGDRP